MEEYYKENYENHPGLSARAGNRILCVDVYKRQIAVCGGAPEPDDT